MSRNVNHSTSLILSAYQNRNTLFTVVSSFDWKRCFMYFSWLQFPKASSMLSLFYAACHVLPSQSHRILLLMFIPYIVNLTQLDRLQTVFLSELYFLIHINHS